MSFRLTNKVWKLDLPTTEKIVLLRLADRAGDDRNEAYPSVNGLARECGLSRRSVQRSLHSLLRAGYLAIARQATPTTPVVYRVTIKSESLLEGGATETPRAAVAPCAKVTSGAMQTQQGCQGGALTIKEPSKDSLSRRAPSLKDFVLDDDDRAWAARNAPDIDADDVFDDLINHCAANGKRYRDYRAAWKNFCKRQQRDRNGTGATFYGPNGKSRPRLSIGDAGKRLRAERSL